MKEILFAKEEVLYKENLKVNLAKLAADNIIKSKSDLNTYPIPRVKENMEYISLVATLLKDHIKIGIPIHPAGEWILDNFYVIEKSVKTIKRELNKQRYINLPGIEQNGFARIYVIANEIITGADGKLNQNDLQEYLESYQTQKTLTMEEIWIVGIFLQIAIIEKIRNICERIFIAQSQKFKVENIVKRIIENKDISKVKIIRSSRTYPFIEYMSYKLKSYGKVGEPYLEALEEQVEKSGENISDIIAREHFDIAVRKLSITNSINTLRNINKMNMAVVFKEINVVEKMLKDDPAGVYPNMDYNSKKCYRSKILEIAKKTKTSEFYVAETALKLCQNKEGKKAHVGYYLIDDGYDKLIYKITGKRHRSISADAKAKIYVFAIYFFSILFTLITFKFVGLYSILLFIPIENAIVQIAQYIISKISKPRHIPKLELEQGIPKESTTMCVIPTILSSEKDVREIFEKMEVYYLANKSENLFFTLLGDCKSSDKKDLKMDEEIEKQGIEEAKRLNKKYGEKFFFTYRKREWSEGERCFMGWERKRGMITEFNEFLLTGNSKFKVNTCKNIPNIKYVITIDSDTNLIIGSVFELVGAMSHILNKPKVDKIQNKVIKGHGIIQPRVALDIENRRKSLFTRIFAGNIGMDIYSLAASDTYQDLFGEGIFTGKGIYDLEVFHSVLKDAIPENKVLSHDLIEGSFLRCGLANDIFVIDDYPKSYNAYKIRKHRWIRGDIQVLGWLKSNLNFLSKYKIFDNLMRNLNEVFILLNLIIGMILCSCELMITSLILLCIPLIIILIDVAINKRSGEARNKLITPNFSRVQTAIFKTVLDIILLPDIANLEINAIVKAVYRMNISHRFLLEWTTANEAEKLEKNSAAKYFSKMKFSVIIGMLTLMYPIGIIWAFSPLIIYLISKKELRKKELSKDNQMYLLEIAKRTWGYFKDNMTNYLISDNYQEDRREKLTYRTSPTNIGLEILSIIASYDLGFETKKYVIDLLENVIEVIDKLPKWNGHLYNWYDTQKLEPVVPFVVSSVDSGNFICYMYILKQFLIDVAQNQTNEENKKVNDILNKVDKIINDTDFSVLYNSNLELFSIAYNVEENRLYESTYDLLASEARQTSLVAIAKKDVPARHWNSLGRTLTTVNNYKGLMSWGGTAFEYLMPNIIIPSYESGLLDESCKLLVMSQKEYANNLEIPWGISESAYSIKDFYGNYQYKTFGIPWLGIKRGLENDSVVSPYSTALALSIDPKGAIANLKRIEKAGAVGKYGFYEAIDYIPKKQVIRSYMAHHEGMILTSIDNKLNNNVFQKRFMKNPEIQGVKVLLQERVPENIIINNEKEIPMLDKKYETYDDIEVRNSGLNVLSTRDFSIIDYEDGNEIIKMRDNILTKDNKIYIKDLKSNKVYDLKNASAQFSMYDSKYEMDNKELKTTVRTTIAPDIEVGIREVAIKNKGNENLDIELTTSGMPILSDEVGYEQHPAFNNMFIRFKEVEGKIIISRKEREINAHAPYFATTLFLEDGRNFEYEINKEKLMKRGDFSSQEFCKESVPFSSKTDTVINPIIAMRTRLTIEPNEIKKVYIISSSNYEEDKATLGLAEYMNLEKLERVFELSKVQTEAEARYMKLEKAEIPTFQKMLGFVLEENINVNNKTRDLYSEDIKTLDKLDASNPRLWQFGISGDFPIVVVKLRDINDFYVVNSVIKAYEYFKSKNIQIELVIMTKVNITDKIMDCDKTRFIGKRAGIFVVENAPRELQKVIEARASIVIDAHKGQLANQINELESNNREKENKKELDKNTKIRMEKNKQQDEITNDIRKNDTKDDTKNDNTVDDKKECSIKDLLFYNGYGGFSKDGLEYWMIQNKENRLPVAWSNILTNSKFGSVVTDSMRRI